MEKEQVLTAYGPGKGVLPEKKEKEGEGVLAQQAVSKGNVKGNDEREDKRRETPEEFRARKNLERKERLEKKLERASKPETMLITRNALDTNDLVFLINAFDFQLRAMRDHVGIKDSKVTIDVFKEQIKKTDVLKDQINQMNKDLSAITGLRYSPPRGFK
jgi:hypothetical protein